MEPRHLPQVREKKPARGKSMLGEGEIVHKKKALVERIPTGSISKKIARRVIQYGPENKTGPKGWWVGTFLLGFRKGKRSFSWTSQGEPYDEGRDGKKEYTPEPAEWEFLKMPRKQENSCAKARESGGTKPNRYTKLRRGVLLQSCWGERGTNTRKVENNGKKGGGCQKKGETGTFEVGDGEGIGGKKEKRSRRWQ